MFLKTDMGVNHRSKEVLYLPMFSGTESNARL